MSLIKKVLFSASVILTSALTLSATPTTNVVNAANNYEQTHLHDKLVNPNIDWLALLRNNNTKDYENLNNDVAKFYIGNLDGLSYDYKLNKDECADCEPSRTFRNTD